MIERVDVFFNTVWIDMYDQIHTGICRDGITELVHILKLPTGVYVHQWERRFTGIEGLLGQTQHDRRIFANGIKHDRVFGLSHDFSDDVNAFSF